MVQWYGAYRPAVMGGRAMVSSTHYLATAAGVEILKAGGNATDAGVATGLCINVLEPHLTTFGGGRADHDLGCGDASGRDDQRPGALARRDLDRLVSGQLRRRDAGGDRAHRHPRAAGAWLDALARHGTMTFAQVVVPAIILAEGGFPLYPRLAATFASEAATVAGWPSSAPVFLPGGRPPREREIWRQPDLAQTFRRLVEAERGGANREAGLEAARQRSTRAIWPRRWRGTAPPRAGC
jgi:gamma-glutamyltranspeptidase/glutathione hydrolase